MIEFSKKQKKLSYNIDDFQDWLKTQIVSFDDTTNEILVAVNDKWELAINKFKEHEESEVNINESIENS